MKELTVPSLNERGTMLPTTASTAIPKPLPQDDADLDAGSIHGQGDAKQTEGGMAALRKLFRAGVGTWRGCAWPTHFGLRSLELNGLESRQAAILARATSGAESAAWRAAAHWLAQVERHAAEAEQEAGRAVTLADSGHWREAMEHMRHACRLESQYREGGTWQALAEAIERRVSVLACAPDGKAK